MNRKIAITGAAFALLAVMLGAMGAHALKKVLDVASLMSFETGVRYQMYHGLGLLFLSTTNLITEKTKKTVYTLILTGVLLFSGSIYLLATNTLTSIDFKAIALATPLGGVFMISAWLLLLLNIVKNK
jgi:uncharacterized membrane protein YgdD (TMEM256/DUF423 family)